ncbi:hypothetical protein [Kitasatospora sp. NPDC002040]|uniref:hypothetical protein n=1 Tax=Kitasatospora sp. NPDC002040 TaxID=3154661 RepID=UPI0033288C05
MFKKRLAKVATTVLLAVGSGLLVSAAPAAAAGVVPTSSPALLSSAQAPVAYAAKVQMPADVTWGS